MGLNLSFCLDLITGARCQGLSNHIITLRLKQLEKNSKSTAVKNEAFKKSAILTDEEPF